jgi:hypothetical protein
MFMMIGQSTTHKNTTNGAHLSMENVSRNPHTHHSHKPFC